MEMKIGTNHRYGGRIGITFGSNIPLHVKRGSYKTFRPLTTHIPITLPADSIIKSMHTCEIDITHITEEAIIAYTIPNLQQHSIMSIRQLFVSGYQLVSTDSKCTFYHNNQGVLEGVKNGYTKLWILPTTTDRAQGMTEKITVNQKWPNTHYIAFRVHFINSKADIIQYWNRCTYCP